MLFSKTTLNSPFLTLDYVFRKKSFKILFFFFFFLQEYSGLFGDVNYLKHEGELRLFGSGSWDTVCEQTV